MILQILTPAGQDIARFTDFPAGKNELLPVSSTWAKLNAVLASGPT
jgi:hypothetical protein